MQVSKTKTFAGYECIKLENDAFALWVTTTVGPRIIGLELVAGKNLFVELPDATIECPGVGEYRLRGGHRLWQAPEDPGRTYLPDDDPVSVSESKSGVKFTQPDQGGAFQVLANPFQGHPGDHLIKFFIVLDTRHVFEGMNYSAKI